MPRSMFDSHRRFTGGGLTGAGKQFMKQVTEKKMIKVKIPLGIREKLKAEFNCTDQDIDKAIQDGVTDFTDVFNKLMADQRKTLTEDILPAPQENENESTITG